MRQIPGCDQDEYGRRDNVPVEEARPVFGVSKNRLERYLTPVWWRDEVYATVRAGWAARGDVPEEVDYQVKVPLTETSSDFNGVTAHHSLYEVISESSKP